MMVRKYEEFSKDPELHKSLRKVRRLKDKPGEGVQVSIMKFLLKVEKEEGQINKAPLGLKILSPGRIKKPLQPISKGARTKPGLAGKPSRPTQGPSPREGGKAGGGEKKDSTRTLGPLEK